MKKNMIVLDMPKSPAAEAIRSLRTNIVYKMHEHNLKTFLFTSPSTQDGKSFIVSNLAVAFSQSRHKVLVIDCDVTKKRQTNVFNVDNSNGLTKALENKNISAENPNVKAEINKIIQETEINNVYIIPSGLSSSTEELYDTPQMDTILNTVKEDFDIIILDSPPINIVSDTMSLCKKVDGVVGVCAIERSKTTELLEMKNTITSMGGNIIGMVVNRMPMSKLKAYTKSYHAYTHSNSLTIKNKNKE